MKRKKRNEFNMEALQDLIAAMDSRIAKVVYENGEVTLYTIPRMDDCENEDSSWDEDWDENGDDCFPEDEASASEDGRCMYCCPECGTCLLHYMEEAE